jgi:glycosyltransferase involved in cell wall biosynthesis
MSINPPLISVVTVVRNNAEGIRATIESVVGQRFAGVEYIVIDGASTDGTLEIIREYADRITVIISEKDTGIYNAMNKGIRLAKGEYINFMNSGDVFADLSVAEKVSPLLVEKNDIVYGNVIVKKHGEPLEKPAPDVLKIMHHIPFCHQSTFSKRTLMQQYEFDEKYKMSADLKFFKQCFLSGRHFAKANIPVCIFNLQGVSNHNRAAGLRENIAIINELDRFTQKIIYNSRTRFTLGWMALRKKIVFDLDL